LGTGSTGSNNDYESDSTPWSVGYIKQSQASNYLWGIDIAGEGTKLDSTSGRNNSITQGTSYNLLLGVNLTRGSNWSTDFAVLFGVRESAEECNDSYLGYECYADEDPDTDYKFNYGATLNFTYQRVFLGVRATEESTQMMIGMKF